MRETYTQISTTHFINDVTGESFEVGQKICLAPNCGIGDCSERFFTITKFWVSEVNGIRDADNGKSFEFVYAMFNENNPYGKSIDNIMFMHIAASEVLVGRDCNKEVLDDMIEVKDMVLPEGFIQFVDSEK